MFELLLIVAIIGVIALCRVVLAMKSIASELRISSARKFFEAADELINQEALNAAAVERVQVLATTINSRRVQFKIIQSIKDLKREEHKGIVSRQLTSSRYSDDLSPDQAKIWRSMMFNWYVAVSAQGSILGVGAVQEFVDYIDQPKDPVVQKAERFADSLFVTH